MTTYEVPVQKNKTPTTPRYANPFSAFRHEMDDLFDKFFASRPAFDFRVPWTEDLSRSLTSKKGMMVPEIDIYETKDTIWLKAELPGLTDKDIELTIKDGVLTLQGEKHFDWEKKDDNIHVMECRYGTFHRVFTLPGSVDVENITAKFTNGILRVTMPKTVNKKSKEKVIRIN